jgi:hypothetical protein
MSVYKESHIQEMNKNLDQRFEILHRNLQQAGDDSVLLMELRRLSDKVDDMNKPSDDDKPEPPPRSSED